MNLSYSLRLLCVLIIAAGLTQAAAQLALSLGARAIVRRLQQGTARRRERILYLVQIAPALLAAFASFALCLPAWLCSEPNRAIEGVSLACVLLALALALWLASGLVRGLRITLRTLRLTRIRRRSATALAADGSLPVLCVPDFGLPVALVGLLRPTVLLSARFAAVADPGALALALAHERSHAAHRDNWKLLTLAFLPRCDRVLPGRLRWIGLWQTAADWAADDDAVAGDPARSLLLAQVLVAAARCAHGPQPPLLCTALTSAEAGLAARVDRLIHLQSDARQNSAAGLGWSAAFVLFAAAALALSPWIYTLSEWLLHLGAA